MRKLIKTQDDLREFLKERPNILKAYEDMKTSYPGRPFFDVGEFAKKIGLKIINHPPKSKLIQSLDKEIISNLSGIILDREVWLNDQQSSARQRFTLAHEIAHYVTDSEKTEDFAMMAYFRADSNYDGYTKHELETERLMDSFAATLLMDEEILIDKKRKVENIMGGDPGRNDSIIVGILAAVFGVSKKAMKWRIEEVSKGILGGR